MKQTAVEFLEENLINLLGDHLPFELLEEAKELEKQNLRIAWDSSEQNMRSTFSSSEYKGIKFEEWLKKNKI